MTAILISLVLLAALALARVVSRQPSDQLPSRLPGSDERDHDRAQLIADLRFRAAESADWAVRQQARPSRSARTATTADTSPARQAA